MSDPKFELVSLGEVMLRLAPPRFERLRSASALNVVVAGSQLNVAANLARLGRPTRFLTKLPDNALGLLARDVCTSYGVDMSLVPLVEGARMGVNYLEFGAAPRASTAIYDRAGSAASSVTAEDFAWAEILSDACIAYTDGIFPGLSRGCFQATLRFLRVAKELGCTTAFDVNYREHLWTHADARVAFGELLEFVDLLVTNRSASEQIFGFSGSDAELIEQYQTRFGSCIVCLTSREMLGVLRGAWTSCAVVDGNLVEGRRFEFDAIDRFGTGDAWTAGFLYAYPLHGAQAALDFGNALCALAHTIEGDIAHISADEVHSILVDQRNLDVRR